MKTATNVGYEVRTRSGSFSPIKILDSPSRATLIGVARITDRESYQLIIEESSTQSIQLFFDVESGLSFSKS